MVDSKTKQIKCNYYSLSWSSSHYTQNSFWWLRQIYTLLLSGMEMWQSCYPTKARDLLISSPPNIIYRKIYLLVVLIIAIANNDTGHLPEIIALAGIGEQNLIPGNNWACFKWTNFSTNFLKTCKCCLAWITCLFVWFFKDGKNVVIVNIADGIDVIIQEKLCNYMPTSKCRYILQCCQDETFFCVSASLNNIAMESSHGIMNHCIHWSVPLVFMIIFPKVIQLQDECWHSAVAPSLDSYYPGLV